MRKSILMAVCAVYALFLAQSALGAPPAGWGDDSPIISGNVNPSLKTPITLAAREANLTEVLKVLADRSGMNFVVGEGVTREKITIILNSTPLDEAVNLLVRAAGLSYEIIGNSILIAEPDKLKDDVGLSSYVVELKYAKADEIAAALSDLAKNIKVDKGGNRLICYASPRVIMEVERIVKALDKPHILVLLETRLIEVSVDKLNQIGLKWDQLNPDLPWDLGTVIRVPEAPLKSGLAFNGTTRGEISLNIALDLMVQSGDARLLMDSKLTTTNNREASLHIGEVIPYTIQSYNLSAAGGVNQQIEKENVGVLLKMTPHINDKDQITLTLSPEVSNITGWKGANSDIPVVRVRRTNTTVRVEDGQTVILAGLLSEEKTTTISKFPILGDIPVLGLLFQNKREEVKKTNLIIEVVPRIIHNPEEISKYMSMMGHGRGLGPGKPLGKTKRRSGDKGQPAAPVSTQPAPTPATATTAQHAAPVPTQQAPAVSTQQTAPAPTQQAPAVSTQQTAPVQTQQAPALPTQQTAPTPTQQAPPASTQQAAPAPTQQATPTSTQKAPGSTQKNPGSTTQKAPASTTQPAAPAQPAPPPQPRN